MKQPLYLLLIVLLLAGYAEQIQQIQPTVTMTQTNASALTSAPSLAFATVQEAASLPAFRVTHFPIRSTWPGGAHPYGPPANFNINSFYRGPDGAVMKLLNGKLVDQPVTQAQVGLWEVALYLKSHSTTNLNLALIEARHLAKIHRTNSATGPSWWFPYPFTCAVAGDPKAIAYAPWYSGMAQGMALDLFTQLYTITSDTYWKTAADGAYASFLYPWRPGVSVSAHPWVTQVDSLGYLWIEEYPKPNPNDDTINGLGFAIYGLIEYYRAFPSSQALLLTQGSLTTFLHGAQLARHPGGIASYSLSHPNLRPAHYHLIVYAQLRIFGSVTSNSAFTHVGSEYYWDYY